MYSEKIILEVPSRTFLSMPTFVSRHRKVGKVRLFPTGHCFVPTSRNIVMQINPGAYFFMLELPLITNSFS